ncbi:putative Mg2+ transporter-C (MgtC) family protein [Jezberella montanilacus]|uniref:Protein MgtC n=1 Tax=Jezberella montanilacus TaxID=323426 RepID=A0A2T0XKQ3_9BURK|nr:MgtC/SapB family protein [Jezberella montanilacus]PRY99492.1 putative Mg2+ transporter-C (MgtC) family protein [Jezberella montanilacus]|eukprot:gene628-630_t
MQSIQNFDAVSLADTFVSLLTAFVLGGLIGAERQYRQRTAGLRTNILVAVGAAVFVDLGNRLLGAEGATRIIAYVVSGIGFLGAGAIMREDGGVKGLNTAATLWCSGAVGACAGADMIGEAVIGTFFILASNTVMRPVISLINRQPINTSGGDTNHLISVVAPRALRKDALKRLERSIESLGLPIQELMIESFGDDEVELKALLSATAVSEQVLDQLVAELAELPSVSQAFWTHQAAE